MYTAKQTYSENEIQLNYGVETNHLGNVLVTVSAKPILNDSSGVVNFRTPDVMSVSDYEPFGSTMQGRSWTTGWGSYRFAFNGKEKDDEIKGTGNSYDFGNRLYDPRTGRWFKSDLKAGKYPFFSPYIFVANNPLYFIDPDGKDLYAATKKDQRMALSALKSAFGSDHGFKFDKNGKLYVDKDVYYSLDNDNKKVLYEDFVKEIVDNTSLELHTFYTDNAIDENNQPTRLNKNGNLGGSDMEISWTIFPPFNGFTNSDPKAYGRLYVGTYNGKMEIDKNVGKDHLGWMYKSDLFWHGIGHQITNLKYGADTRVPQNLSVVIKLGKETMGFQNLYRTATNKIPATGNDQHKPDASGSDDSKSKEKPKENPNPPTSYRNTRNL